MRNLSLMIILLCLTYDTTSADQLSVTAENDVIYKTDNYFTHGTRITYATNTNMGIAIGQNIYTPYDKEATALLPYDRPYAGYLYGSIYETLKLDTGYLYTELQLGVSGPMALAEETQTWIHEQIGSAVCKGWANQTYNHFAWLIATKYVLPVLDTTPYFAVDPYVNVIAGNVGDYLSAGINVYAGYNVPADRSQPKTIPYKSVKPLSLDMLTACRYYAYVYAGIEPKVMLYNAFLEDKRFAIHPETLVYDRTLGIVVGCDHLELAFTLCFRSKEFEEQALPERFGSARVTVHF